MTDNDTAWPATDPRIGEILDIVAAETGVERARLLPDATIASLDIASLDLVQAMFAIETRFNVEVPVAVEGENGEFGTVRDLVTHVLATVDRGGAPA